MPAFVCSGKRAKDADTSPIFRLFLWRGSVMLPNLLNKRQGPWPPVSAVERTHTQTEDLLFHFVMDPAQAYAVCFTTSCPVDRTVCRYSYSIRESSRHALLGYWFGHSRVCHLSSACVNWDITWPGGALPRFLLAEPPGATGRTAGQVLMAPMEFTAPFLG